MGKFKKWFYLFFFLTLACLTPGRLKADERTSPVNTALPAASWNHLPRWRGFNLLSKFSKDWSNGPFSEEDFKMISELGFNFVRLPMDYRVWTLNGDWNQIDEKALKEIDQAVEWGKKYNLHVCLNFHRAPGYCVNPPKEPKNLWIDPEAQQVCAKHWALFAKRYKGIPNRRLSFNLFNEPLGVDDATYAKVAGIMVAAIHREDPDRLILADGNNGGKDPVPALLPLQVAQSGRGYQPFSLTHYQAPWMEGSMTWPLPQWPAALITSTIYGPDKPNLQGPWTLEGTFDKKSELRLHLGTVSRLAVLAVLANGNKVFEKRFTPGAGTGEWKTSAYKEEWKIYQNFYDKDYTAPLPAHTRRIELVVTEGDWLDFSEVEVKPLDGSKSILIQPANRDWGIKPATLYLDKEGVPDPALNAGMTDRAWLKKNNIDPWKALEAQGAGVMVGEWGCYNKTPHEVALRWMKDCLENWKEADWGWAVWNFRGEFGVLDSGRADVAYETWNGHNLDREMLKLLQAY